MLTLSTHKNIHVQRYYDGLIAQANGKGPSALRELLLAQINNWEAREERFFEWSTAPSTRPHPLGGLLDAFDIGILLIDLRVAYAKLTEA